MQTGETGCWCKGVQVGKGGYCLASGCRRTARKDSRGAEEWSVNRV